MHDDTEARLLETALQLFASLGYDPTTTEMLADAAGVGQEAVQKAGGKTGLYYGVMEYVNNALEEATRAALARVTRDREGLHQLLDCHLDFYFERPEALRLWVHRSLSDAADLTDIEERYGAPVLGLIEDAFQDTGVVDEADEYRMMTNVFHWCIQGFIVGGVHAPGGVVLGSEDPELRSAFRAYMHHLADALLGSSAR